VIRLTSGTQNIKRRHGSALLAVIYDRYEIWDDGVVYDTEKAEDIPSHIFEIRDLLIPHDIEEYLI
jgi:hypothetical protein